jgi:hypothetical protein
MSNRQAPDSEAEWDWLTLPTTKSTPDELHLHNLLAHVFSKRLGAQGRGKGKQPRRGTDTTLADLRLATPHCVQRVPPEGDCFYYSLAAILLQCPQDLGNGRDEVDFYITHVMRALRMFSARTTLADANLLLATILDEDNAEELGEFYPELTVAAVRSNPAPFLKHFDAEEERESYPYADATDVANLLSMPVSNHLLFVIFQTRELTRAQSGRASSSKETNQWVCQFFGDPSEKLGIVFVRRSGRGVQHYEPILWELNGKWTHTISCAMFLDDTFLPLRTTVLRACPDIRRYVTDWERNCERRDPYRKQKRTVITIDE